MENNQSQSQHTPSVDHGQLHATGMLPEETALVMQQDSVAPETSVYVEQVSDEETPLVEPVVFHTTYFAAMITLDYTAASAETYKGLKNVLQSVTASNEESYNLLSPFRMHDKKKTNSPPVGIVRHMLRPMFKAIDALNHRKLVYVGKGSDLFEALEESVSALTDELRAMFAFQPEDVVASFGEDPDITFGDLVQLTSWTTSTEADSATVNHNVVINLNVKVPALYDSSEPATFIKQLVNMLNTFIEKAGVTSQLLLGITMGTSDLNGGEALELFNELLGEEGRFFLYSKSDAISIDPNGLLPPFNQVDRLFNNASDMVLIKAVGAVEEEVAEDADASE